MTAPDTDRPAQADGLDQVCRGAAELLRALGHPLRRLTVRVGDSLVEIEWPTPTGQPAPAGPGRPNGDEAGPAVAGPTESAEAPTPPVHVVTAPHVGTFYRCPEPGAEPFVSEGDPVKRGQQIGILEAMKLMNPVESDSDGRVLEVLVADGTPVEFAQPLIALYPHGGADGGADGDGSHAARPTGNGTRRGDHR